MSINLLDISEYGKVFDLYKQDNTFTPIIASVIDQSQEGEIYRLGASNNKAYLIEHRSGYAQIIGNFTEELQEEVKTYLLEKKFKYPLFRLYNAGYNNFADKFNGDLLDKRERSYLENYDIFNKIDLANLSNELTLEPINFENFDSVDAVFAPLFRFWNDKEDFIARSRAIVLFLNDIPVSMCYASAISHNVVDINIMTNAECRQKGYAKITVVAFIRQCLSEGLEPIWDCFTTNQGSMALNKSIGFAPKYDAYSFLTIEK